VIKLEFSRQTIEKYLNNILHENTPSGGLVFPCGQTGMTKLTVAFPSCVNASKKMQGDETS